MTVTVDTNLGDRLLQLWETASLPERADWITKLAAAPDPANLRVLMAAAARSYGTPWGLWRDDPVGFTQHVLDESLTRRQSEIFESVRDNPFTAVPSCFASGKCVEEHETLALADGTVTTAGQLVGREFALHTWDETTGQTRVRPAHATWNATEPVYRLTTSAGRTAVRNAAHPFWAASKARKPRTKEHGYSPGILPTVRGWTPLGDLQPGDLVLIPEQHPAEGTQIRPLTELILIGYLLGDGGTTADVRFTQQDGPALEEFRRHTEAIGCELVKVHGPYDWAVRGRVRRHNPILPIVAEAGLRGCKARHKRLPQWAWTLCNEDLSVLLGRLFACDAWVHMRETKDGGRAAEVGISLASEGLIRDVERAMLRLGVWGRVRHRTVGNGSGERFDAWEWLCRDEDALLTLAKALHVPGKQDAIAAAVTFVQGRSRARGRPGWERRNAPTGYRWDTVTSIEKLGESRTVAVEVDGEHTFLTGLVEHNTHGDARLALWWVMVHAAGSARVITTASRMRQVITQLWPHIRRAHAQHNLPGRVDAAQWKMPGLDGQSELVAWGFTPPQSEPEAVQGEHAPHVLIIIDEAGLINPLTGQAWLSASTGEHTRVLATGNPPTDEEGSWLEFICSSENWNVLPITAMDTPNWTGENVRCKACHDWRTRPHQVAVHLITHADAALFANDYGEESAFYKAKVLAQFTKGAANKAIPAKYVAAARFGKDAKELPDHITLDLLAGPYSRIRLGVDTAQGGADRMVIARSVGRLTTIVWEEQGEATRNTFDCAGYVKQQVEEARKLEGKLGLAVDQHKNLYGIDIVIDATGDRGPVDTLTAWNSEGLLGRNVHVIGINFGEHAEDRTRYRNRRAELWWNMRQLLQPDDTGECDVYLEVTNSVAGELAEPKYMTLPSGQVQLESKDDIRARGRRSPDHADAIALSRYDPESLRARRPRERVWGA